MRFTYLLNYRRSFNLLPAETKNFSGKYYPYILRSRGMANSCPWFYLSRCYKEAFIIKTERISNFKSTRANQCNVWSSIQNHLLPTSRQRFLRVANYVLTSSIIIFFLSTQITKDIFGL